MPMLNDHCLLLKASQTSWLESLEYLYLMQTNRNITFNTSHKEQRYHFSVFHQDCQCKTELLMHGIIIFDDKYGQHQWETVFRASRCHFHHRPVLITRLYWSTKTVDTIDFFFFHILYF